MQNFIKKIDNNNIKYFFNEFFKKQNFIDEQRSIFFEEKDFLDFQSFEFSRYTNAIVPLSISRFSIIPDESDAPSNVIATLTRRFLDLQTVRAEVMLMTLETNIEVLIPVHIYLLSNHEFDFRVKPPTLKTFFQINKKLNLKFKGKRFFIKTRRNITRKPYGIFWVFYSKGFVYYLSSSEFIKILFKRILALVESDENIEFPNTSAIKNFIKIEIGTLRTLFAVLLSFNKLTNTYYLQRRRELNP